MADNIHIEEKDFKQKVLENKLPVLVDFFADWCGPCRMMGPVIQQLADDYSEKASVYKINVDNAETISSQYGITTIPALVFFKNGKEVKRVIGMQKIENLKKTLDEMAA